MGTVRPKSKQGNTTNPNIFSVENEEKKELLRWESNPRHTAYRLHWACVKLIDKVLYFSLCFISLIHVHTCVVDMYVCSRHVRV